MWEKNLPQTLLASLHNPALPAMPIWKQHISKGAFRTRKWRIFFLASPIEENMSQIHDFRNSWCGGVPFVLGISDPGDVLE